MKPLQVIHVILTGLLLVVILGFVTLALTGTIEIRVPSKSNVSGRSSSDVDTRTSATAIQAKAHLLVVRGAKPNTEYPIFEGQNIIGRADQKPVDIDLELQESPDRVWSSRQHAVIKFENGSLSVEDLNSSNGTYVNGIRVPPGKSQELKSNDLIQIGEVQLKVIL